MCHLGANEHFQAFSRCNSQIWRRRGLGTSPCNGAQSHLGNLLHHSQVTLAGTTLVTCMPLYRNICNFTGVGLLGNSCWIIHSQQFCFLCCSHALHTPLWQHTVKGARRFYHPNFQITWYNGHNSLLSYCPVTCLLLHILFQLQYLWNVTLTLKE